MRQSCDGPGGLSAPSAAWALTTRLRRANHVPSIDGCASRHALDRVAERRRAAALARHYRDAEQLSIAEIARRLGRAPATVKAYLYDPTGEKARAVKARYRGYCRTCGADTSPRNGKGDAYLYCRRCRPGAASASGRASACARRCAAGPSSTGARRRRMTGRARTRAGAARRRCAGSSAATGRRRRP